MKIHALVACFIATFGIYLLASGLPGVVWVFIALRSDSLYGLDPAVVWLITPVLGIIALCAARSLGALASRIAGVGPEETVSTQASPRELLTILLTLLGVYLVITQGAQLARVLVLLFRVRAGSPVISEQSAAKLPDATDTISFALSLIGALFLLRRGSWIVSLIFPAPAQPPGPGPRPDPAP